MKKTNLLELITKSEDEINHYLGDVPAKQFIEDVKSLSDKDMIKSLIAQLEKLL